MRQFFKELWILLFCCGMAGCAMCSNTHDYEYAAFGGLLPRGDQLHGRVGSAFADAGGGTVEGEYSASVESIDEFGEPSPADGEMVYPDEATSDSGSFLELSEPDDPTMQLQPIEEGPTGPAEEDDGAFVIPLE